MNYLNTNGIREQINLQRSELQQTSGLPFANRLSLEQIQQVLKELGMKVRQRVYDPLTTLCAFLSQVMSQDHSCRDAVARVIACRVASGRKPCSARTGSYSEARQRLPEEVPARLTRQIACQMEEQASSEWLWKERRVKIADGSTVVLADTAANQKAFPQPSSQKAGLGFPMVRIMVIFSLACGAALELAIGRYEGKKTGENELFRSLIDSLDEGDVVLGDRLFDCYRDIASLTKRGVDIVYRMNASRHFDFRRGTWLGKDDHVVTWKKPKFDSSRFDRGTYNALPETMSIREIRYQVQPAGFRTREVVLVTTLLDTDLYPADDVAALYRERWHAELDLNSLKTTLQMEHLRCKTPQMVRKELWVHFLAYNLIRQTMAEAARQHASQPRHLSFKGALQTMTAFAPYLIGCTSSDHHDLMRSLLTAIASHRVGDRPNRSEPRAIKRRKSKYPYLTVPRNIARERLTT